MASFFILQKLKKVTAMFINIYNAQILGSIIFVVGKSPIDIMEPILL